MLSSASFGAVFLVLWLIRDRTPFYLLCGAASLTYAATLAGLAVAGRGMLVSTLLCIGLGAYNSYVLAAVRTFEGRRVIDGWTIGLPLLSGAAFCAFAVFPGGVPTGRIVNSVALGLSTVAVGILLFRLRGSRAPRSLRIVGFVQFAYVPCYLVSVGLDLSGGFRADWLALVPMLSDQLLLGVLNIALLAMPGEQAEAALRQAALRDPLTGAWNRAGLVALERALALPATVIVFDIDHFKQINDGHGHAAGDAVLRALSRGARAALPAEAHLVRLGGDEFGVVLPGCDPPAARQVAERLRAASLGIPHCTISLGVASTLTGETDLTAAFSRADAMLYRAKAAGRNCLAA
jgi:diguanylate cyclase (GGDEF)-like protein